MISQIALFIVIDYNNRCYLTRGPAEMFRNSTKNHEALLEMYKQLLASDVFHQNELRTPSYLMENIEKTIRLIKQNNMLDTQDSDGQLLLISLLNYFSKKNDFQMKMMLDCMQKLIDAGASPEAKDKIGETILDYTIRHYKRDLFYVNFDNIYHGYQLTNKIDTPEFYSNKQNFSVVILLLNACATFDIDNPLLSHDEKLPWYPEWQHRRSFNLFDGSKISHFNVLFLFLKGISQQLLEEKATSSVAYTVIHDRLSQLMVRLSTEPEQKTDQTVKSLNVLYQEAQVLFKKLPKPTPHPVLSTNVLESTQILPLDLQKMILDYYPHPDIVIDKSSHHSNSFWSRGKKVVDEVVEAVTLSLNY